MRDILIRAQNRILSLTGEDALLRGVTAGKVNVQDGVEVYEKNGDGESLFLRSVATMQKALAPKRGDILVLLNPDATPRKAYRIEGLHSDNGFSVRHVVLPVVLP